MANTIRIKRRASGVGAGAPSGLANAELAYNEGDNILYYGFGTGGVGGTATQVIPIGGSGAYLNKNNNLSDLNNAQTSRNNLASNTVTSGSFMRGNGTNVLMGSIIASDVPTLNQNTTGNAGTVTNGVYTTGTQSIGGVKSFSEQPLFYSGILSSGPNRFTVGPNPFSFQIDRGDTTSDKLVFDVDTEYYSEGGLTTTLKTNGPIQNIIVRLPSDSGTLITNFNLGNITMTAGSGLLGGGSIDETKTFNIGQGNGISVSADSVSVDSTVVRTTGTQSINGSKTFGNETTFTSGIIVSNQTASTIASFDGNKNVVSLSTGTYPSLTELVYVKGVTSAIQTQLNNKIAKTSSTTIGNIPTWSVTTGDALGTGYSVETTLTGGAGALPRADAVKTYVDSAITSGFSTNDAMVFKGTLGSGGTVTALPTGTVSAGWSYRVITTGTYAGVVSEIGDLIIAVADAAGNANSTWTVVQTNLDGAVIGPASATDNALAVFNGATGKLIKNSSLIPTTVGSGLINLTNPGAISFLRINADSTITALSDVNFRTAIGAGTSSAVGTVTSVGGTGSTAGLTLTGTVTSAGSLTLGGTLSTPVSTINDSTTVGQNLVKLANPSAIRFVRINADNSVSSLSDTDFRTAIGAGTSSTVGTVTSVAALTLATSGTDLSSSVANGTTTPTITLNVPTASASVRGVLSSGDWTTFNGKAAANQTMFIGTTSVAINRSSAALVLTGITSIDGNAATVTNGVYTTGDQTIAGVKTLSNRPVLNSGLTVQASAAGSAGTYFPVFTADPGTSAQILTTRTASNLKTDLSLNNVENTALSTWAGSTSITTLGTVTTGTWSATTIAATKGGTGQTTYAIGDLLYADTTTSLAKLADVATGNVLLAGGVSTAPLWGKINLTSATHVSGTLPVANGGTAQTSYTDGQLLIGNSTGNTLTKATLTQGTNVTITNGNGSITIASTDTNTATAADDILDGSNTGTQITYAPYATNQAASASPRFYNTSDNPSGSGRLNVSAYFYATRLFDNGSRVVTASTICSDAGNCTWDGGDF